MLDWATIKKLQDKKLKLQIKLSNLLNSNDITKDDINELNAEIKHLDSQINKILGSKEVKMLEEIKHKKNRVEERNIKSFYALKDKYKKISKMKLATSHMIDIIDNLNNKEYDVVKVK